MKLLGSKILVSSCYFQWNTLYIARIAILMPLPLFWDSGVLYKVCKFKCAALSRMDTFEKERTIEIISIFRFA